MSLEAIDALDQQITLTLNSLHFEAGDYLWQFLSMIEVWYPLYAAMPPRSGTFGSYYYDDREVEMYCNSTCTEVRIQISAKGHVNPEIPRTLRAEEIEFYTAQAKQKYMLSLWGLE